MLVEYVQRSDLSLLIYTCFWPGFVSTGSV